MIFIQTIAIVGYFAMALIITRLMWEIFQNYADVKRIKVRMSYNAHRKTYTSVATGQYIGSYDTFEEYARYKAHLIPDSGYKCFALATGLLWPATLGAVLGGYFGERLVKYSIRLMDKFLFGETRSQKKRRIAKEQQALTNQVRQLEQEYQLGLPLENFEEKLKKVEEEPKKSLSPRRRSPFLYERGGFIDFTTVDKFEDQ
jgi:hypothetical protein